MQIYLINILKSFNAYVRVPSIPKNIKHARYKYYIYINSNMLKKNFTRDKIIKEFIKNNVPCFSGSCSEIYQEKAFY